MNLATLLEGPAIVWHRGQLFHFRGGLTVTPLREVFNIDSDLYGSLDARALDNSVVVTGTPIGIWTDEQLAVLHRWNNPVIGSLLTPRYDISAINTSTDVATLVGAAAPRAGCPIRMVAFPGGTLPAAITGTTLYFWGASGKLYDTEAHAVADDGTGKIDFADDGDGDLAIIEQEYLQIDAISANRRIVFHNAAVSAMPPVILSAIQSALGAVSFVCFRKEGAAWADANSLYTVSKVALSDTPPDAADIPTQAYSCVFGAAPWDAFKSRGPVTITPTLQLEPVTTDGLGTLGMKIAGIEVAATLQPQDFSESQLLDLLTMQGGTAARGKSVTRANLVVSGTGVHCTLYNGAPRQLPQTFSPNSPRAGELEIRGNRTAGSAAFRFAEAAP